jgi:hypothetical protein
MESGSHVEDGEKGSVQCLNLYNSDPILIYMKEALIFTFKLAIF